MKTRPNINRFQGIGVVGVVMIFGLTCLIVAFFIMLLTCRGAILTSGCPGGDEIFGETFSKPIAWSTFPIAGVGIVSVIVSVIVYTIQHSGKSNLSSDEPPPAT